MGVWYDTGAEWIELGTGATDPGAPTAEFGTSPFGTAPFGGTA